MTIPVVEPVKLDAKALEAALDAIPTFGIGKSKVEGDRTIGDKLRFGHGTPNPRAYVEAAITAYLSALSPVSPSPAIEHVVGDGWIEWKGGECPFQLPEVEVRMRDGDTLVTTADDVDWRHLPSGTYAGDIIAYRVLAASPIAPRTSEPVAPPIMVDTGKDEPIPVEVFPLAQYLGEEMEERGWTSWDVGLRMGGATTDEISKDAFIVELILSVLDGSLKWTPDLYRKLERAFGVSNGFFERLNAAWLDYPDRRAPYDAPEHLFSGVYSVKPEGEK